MKTNFILPDNSVKLPDPYDLIITGTVNPQNNLDKTMIFLAESFHRQTPYFWE
jgi:hypothetical protein